GPAVPPDRFVLRAASTCAGACLATSSARPGREIGFFECNGGVTSGARPGHTPVYAGDSTPVTGNQGQERSSAPGVVFKRSFTAAQGGAPAGMLGQIHPLR